ncbi:type II toxin-antitoxin system antitoxin SocA domain-containing protein [Leptospira adleri]|uniref:type II toxin-antitoxin system antitoxin SocA domain-containing protein n=1 Tax=Leptospira adleri TaxID=2023186 RepID=UPI0014383F83|nr:type II toxin-antitoxin system antitoxin SocA domain-containing protein [Leptospira adleri]
MKSSEKEKLDQLILFFAIEHAKHSGLPLFMTMLLKFIDLFDLTLLKNFGIPPLGLNYTAFPQGPLPKDLYKLIKKTKYESNLFKVVKLDKSTSDGIVIIPSTAEYDLDYFSDIEIDKMYELIEKFSTNYKNNTAIISETHKLKAWQKAWYNKKKPSQEEVPMNLKDMFDEKKNKYLLDNFEAYLALKKS